jgi:hypothetical protein
MLNNGILLSAKYRESKIYLLEYLTRQSSNLNSIYSIYKTGLVNLRYEHSIGLLLRGSLADTLFLLYLNLSKRTDKGIDPDQFHLEILKLNADQIVRTFNDNESLKDLMDKEPFNQYIQVGNNGKAKSLYGNPIVIKEINRFLKSSCDRDYFSLIYKKWEIYSKYEHFGFITYEMQMDDFDSLINEHLFCIIEIMSGIVIAIDNLKMYSEEIEIDSNLETKIIEQFHLIVSRLGKFEP